MSCTRKRDRKQEPVPMTMASAVKIVAETAASFGLSSDDLLGVSRLRTISYARFEAWHRMRTEIKIHHEPVSYPRIASWFGRDHSTVILGLRRYMTEQVQEEIDRLKATVSANGIKREQPVNTQALLWPNRSFYGRISHGAAALPTPSAPLVANT